MIARMESRISDLFVQSGGAKSLCPSLVHPYLGEVFSASHKPINEPSSQILSVPNNGVAKMGIKD